ncbi:Uncharacterised protein [Escherichia coli]|uniref:Uncharacterized protein n=1 Tax=Escherichia coli TaxID=562 RepID=A0A7U1E1L2_ECOLX|nr:hypothetical protein [Escherichia coli]STF91373.1 Uncharacterised protein [Escherichia coli]
MFHRMTQYFATHRIGTYLKSGKRTNRICVCGRGGTGELPAVVSRWIAALNAFFGIEIAVAAPTEQRFAVLARCVCGFMCSRIPDHGTNVSH